MKTVNTLMMIASALTLFACGNESKKTGDSSQQDSAQTEQTEQATPPSAQTSGFDINSIAVSDKELGTFPFFSMPEGMTEQNKPVQRKFDRLFFAVNGVMTPIEGKVWKANVTTKSGNYDEWSLPLFEKSYDEAIKAVGGVNIFDGMITKEEYDRYKDKAAYLGEDGSIGYTGQNIKTYVIRRANGDDVYIQLTGNNAGGKINIAQKEAFKQTITMLKADDIQKDLSEKGKAVLHINFDTDKATLKPDGSEAVAEIAKALQADGSLKIAINGYTDNSGNDAHNLRLSKDRAAAVLKALTDAGIDKSRLDSEGFGAKDPIGDNNTPEGKAQNRRVELVKK